VTRPPQASFARPALIGAALAVLLVGPALAAVRTGTPGPEILVGSPRRDVLTGGGGDELRGLAGDDTYQFADDWGKDIIEELPNYKVKGKRKPGGVDTLSFAGVVRGGVGVMLVPEWVGAGSDSNRAVGAGEARVDLGTSIVENVVGSRGEDDLIGGAGSNRLATGGGESDSLSDYGGWDDGAGGLPELPPSSDVYAGGAANEGSVFVADFGGKADVVDLRPLRLDEAYLAAIDCDIDRELECLQVVTGPASQIVVRGQFGPYLDFTARSGQQGQVETLLFADGSVAIAPKGSSIEARSGRGAPLGRADTEHQRAQAEHAPTLAEIARTDAGPTGLPDTLGAVGGGERRDRTVGDGGSDRADRDRDGERNGQRAGPDRDRPDDRPGRPDRHGRNDRARRARSS
jgi:hypothetical protein